MTGKVTLPWDASGSRAGSLGPPSVQAEAVMPVDVDGGCRVGVGGEWTLRQRHDAELCANMTGGDGQRRLPTQADRKSVV